MKASRIGGAQAQLQLCCFCNVSIPHCQITSFTHLPSSLSFWFSLFSVCPYHLLLISFLLWLCTYIQTGLAGSINYELYRYRELKQIELWRMGSQPEGERKLRVWISPKSESSSGGGVAASPKGQCLCSPTTHPGSFRCRLHRSSPPTKPSPSTNLSPSLSPWPCFLL